MLILYDGTTSVCAIKVRCVLAEKGLAFQSRTLDLRKGDQFDADYLKLNPGAVVPTLIDRSEGGDEVIVESSVIMQYLEDLSPEPTLLPDSPADRARMRLWLKRIDDPVHPSTGILTHATAFRPSFLAKSAAEQKAHFDKMPDAGRRARQESVYRDGLDSPIVAGAVKTFDKFFTDMDAALAKNDYLAGPAYSLADAAATPYANRLRDLKLLPVWTDKFPRVADWLARIEARPSFTAAVTDYFTPKDAGHFANIDEGAPALARKILAA
jgi:glutathione S-transferase